MRVILHGAGSTRELLGFNPQHTTLGAILGRHQEAVAWVRVNGQLLPDWESYVPQPEDTIDLWLRPGFGAVEGLLVAIAIQIAVSLVVFGITYGIGLLLANKPDPTKNQKPEETFGIAGLSNTLALGTPKFLVYGTRRVFGHLIASSVALQGRYLMAFGALYFMGEGPIEALTAVEINAIAEANYEGVSWDWRPGTATQSAMADFSFPRQVYQDGREVGQVVYQSRSREVTSLTAILAMPYLQTISTRDGTVGPGELVIQAWSKRLQDASWTPYHLPSNQGGDAQGNYHIIRKETGQFFIQLTLQFPTPEQWQMRLSIAIGALLNENNAMPTLYNVQENLQYTPSGAVNSHPYPYSALLKVSGVASEQITSFEGMKVSALVKGRRVRVWNGVTYQTEWTANRVWIVRDLLLNTRIGLGHRIPASLWNDAAALEAATYYNAEIQGQRRDQCDLLINQRQAAWDTLREVMTEGNAALVPSGGQFAYLVDKARPAVTQYADPNIVAGSVTVSLGRSGTPVNRARGEFPDATKNYKLQILEAALAGTESQAPQEQTISLKSITRPAQAIRALTYALKKTALIQQRYTWQSPLTAVVSEPFDVVRLAYQTPTRRHGSSGVLQAGSTTRTLLLDQLITLEAGTTYEVLVRVLSSNEPPYVRTFEAQASGAVVMLEIAPDLPHVPQAGDLYSLGVLGTQILSVLFESSQYDATQDLFTLSGSAYVPQIYDTSGVGVTPLTASLFWDLPALYAEDIAPRYHASYDAEEEETTRTRLGETQAAIEPWPGAQLWRSHDPDDAAFGLDAQGAPLPVRGVAVSVLAAAPAQYTDQTSSVEVDFSGGGISTIPAHDLQMGFNHLLLGRELLQCRVATFVGLVSGRRRYRLSLFLRGRKGTEEATGSHQSGETCVLLGTGVFTRDILRSERARPRQWKSPTIGLDVSEVPATPYAVPSQNLRPWTVGSPRARRLSAGTWVLSWYGRARFLGAWVDGGEALPDYDVLYYLVRVYGDATYGSALHQWEIGQSTDYQAVQQVQYTATQQQADFGAVQDTLYWSCCQVGMDDTSVFQGLTSRAGEGT